MFNFKSKKVIAMLLASMSLVSVLSGCGGTSGTSKKNKPVQIEFWYGLGGKLGKNVQDKIKAFNASQKDVVVKGIAQGSYDETYTALQAAISAKKAPAVVLLQPDQMSALANKNVLAPLDKYISDDKNFAPNDFITPFYNEGKIKGKQYSIPMYGTTQVMYYRKDMFQKAGLSEDVLNNWEDLTEALPKLTQKSGGSTSVYGWEPMYGPDNLVDMVLSKGGKILSKDGKKVTIDTKEWTDTWEMVRKEIFQDKNMRIHSGGQGWQYWYDTIDDVMKDKAAGYIGSSGDQGDLDFTKIAAHVQPGFKDHKAAPVALAQVMCVPAVTSGDNKKLPLSGWNFLQMLKTLQIGL